MVRSLLKIEYWLCLLLDILTDELKYFRMIKNQSCFHAAQKADRLRKMLKIQDFKEIDEYFISTFQAQPWFDDHRQARAETLIVAFVLDWLHICAVGSNPS